MTDEKELIAAKESLWALWQAIPSATRQRHSEHYRRVEQMLLAIKTHPHKDGEDAEADKAPAKAKR
jgi:hypothetical protein